MSRSPFPGMDPYLERFWPSVRGRLVHYAGDALNSGLLPSDLRADTEERVFIEHADDPGRSTVYPDVYVHEGNKIPPPPAGGSNAVLINPVVVRSASETERERFLVITDHLGQNVITTIEFL